MNPASAPQSANATAAILTDAGIGLGIALLLALLLLFAGAEDQGFIYVDF